jgi:hypothetical protein
MMQSTHQVVDGVDQWSLLAELNGHVSRKDSDDAASDCSTVVGNHGTTAQHIADNLSDCCSESDAAVETLIIFDWDDTLFPTSWLQKQGLLRDMARLSIEQEKELVQMSERVASTLQTAMHLGHVVIVTNGEQGWIEMSCTKFMPSLVSLLKTVEIVSARSTYEHSSQEPSEWKRLAFEEEVRLFYGSKAIDQQRNVVSLGDSLHELFALKSVTEGVANCCGKSIKFIEAPSIQQLAEQHELLIDCLVQVVEHDGDLDVEVGAECSD